MQLLFEALDKDVDCKLDWEEFSVIAEVPEIKTWLSSMDIETDDLWTLFRLIDEDNSGQITLEELVRRIPRVRGAASIESSEQAVQNAVDTSSESKIDPTRIDTSQMIPRMSKQIIDHLVSGAAKI